MNEFRGFVCKRCLHVWTPVKVVDASGPTSCPNCRSPFWDTGRKQAPVSPVNRKPVGQGELCSYDTCKRLAVERHPANDMPCCHFHVRVSTQLYRFVSVRAAKLPGGSVMSSANGRSRWIGMRADSTGLHGPVVVTHAVKVCAKCGVGVQRRYEYCVACFQTLEDHEKARIMAGLRSRRRMRRGPLD